MRSAATLLLLCGLALPFSPAAAFDLRAPRAPQAVFGFGGVMTEEDMGRSANPLTVDYERRTVLGGGYQHFLHETPRGLQLGMEVGAAVRAIAGLTAELWAGPVLRHEGIVLFDTLRVAPSFTAALSAVSDAHPGRERELEARSDGNAHLLFYLGPEISLSRADAPEVEAFWRLHHRSGANGTLGDMRGAMNANVVGLRWRY